MWSWASAEASHESQLILQMETYYLFIASWGWRNTHVLYRYFLFIGSVLVGAWVCLCLHGALPVDQSQLSYTQLIVPAGPARGLCPFESGFNDGSLVDWSSQHNLNGDSFRVV
jgi:hypothetical protein